MTSPASPALSFLASVDTTLARLEEEEEELRRISPEEGAHGRNASDYRNMYDLFMAVVEQAKSLRADPKAFVNEYGRYDSMVMNAWTKMASTAMKAISELNKMRNADRMVSHILDKQARDLVQASSIELGVELKNLLDAVDRGVDRAEIGVMIKRIMFKKLPEIFHRSAAMSLGAVREEFGISTVH